VSVKKQILSEQGRALENSSVNCFSEGARWRGGHYLL